MCDHHSQGRRSIERRAKWEEKGREYSGSPELLLGLFYLDKIQCTETFGGQKKKSESDLSGTSCQV